MSTQYSLSYESPQVAFARELHDQIDKGTAPAFAQAHAWRAFNRAQKVASAPDESRLTSDIKVVAKAKRQTRGGQYADAHDAYRTLEAIKALADAASTPAQRERIQGAVDALSNQGKANTGRRRSRASLLKTLRKSLRIIIADVGADKYALLAREYVEALLKIETELAFLGGTWNGAMHFENVDSILPLHVQRVGRDAIMERFKALLRRYGDAYTEAAIASVDTGKFRLPSLIDGREIGVRFRLTDARLKSLFPQGHHGIRACDRDQVNEERRAKGLPVRKPWRPKTREELKHAAWEQREIEEMMAHFGYTRATVMKWRSSKPKPGSDAYGEKFCDMSDLMEKQKAMGIDPKRKEMQLSTELARAVCKFHKVQLDVIRQWRRRGKLEEKVAEYRRETPLAVVA